MLHKTTNRKRLLAGTAVVFMLGNVGCNWGAISAAGYYVEPITFALGILGIL